MVVSVLPHALCELQDQFRCFWKKNNLLPLQGSFSPLPGHCTDCLVLTSRVAVILFHQNYNFK